LLEHFPNRVFKALKSLKELQLGSNRISEIGKRAFVNLVEVTVLDLSDDLLESIPTEALKHLPNLADLNLASNNIKMILDQSFQNSKLSFLISVEIS
jgi:Leucine-rich repeat (LRR) protein